MWRARCSVVLFFIISLPGNTHAREISTDILSSGPEKELFSETLALLGQIPTGKKYLGLLSELQFDIKLKLDEDNAFWAGGYLRGKTNPQDQVICDEFKEGNFSILQSIANHNQQNMIHCRAATGEECMRDLMRQSKWQGISSEITIFLKAKNLHPKTRPEALAAYVAHEFIHESLHSVDMGSLMPSDNRKRQDGVVYSHAQMYAIQQQIRLELGRIGKLYEPWAKNQKPQLSDIYKDNP